jgi:hypothetical protein
MSQGVCKNGYEVGFLPLLWILAVGLWALGWSNFATNWKSEFLVFISLLPFAVGYLQTQARGLCCKKLAMKRDDLAPLFRWLRLFHQRKDMIAQEDWPIDPIGWRNNISFSS